MGILSQLYRYADITYIGGGFDTGIHNILEPAIFGIPILIGPNYQKFEEAKVLIALGGVLMVTNKEQIFALEQKLLDTEYRKSLGTINSNYLFERKGGTITILNKLVIS